MTPTSSTNSSSAHLPRSNNAARGASGASLLQERLRERKVESARQIRRMSADMGDGGRDVQSSPVKAHMIREERRPSSSGVGPGKGMGVKQIEEVSTQIVLWNSRLILHSKFLRCTNRTSTSNLNSTIVDNDRKPLRLD